MSGRVPVQFLGRDEGTQDSHGQTDRHARATENITFATPLAGGINTDLRTVTAGKNVSGNNSL